MFKILITTKYWTEEGAALSTTVVDFQSKAEADLAYERIIETVFPNNITTTVIKLY